MKKVNYNNRKIGTCALCGKFGELTFEHIPPKSTLNNKPAKMVSVQDIFDNDKGNDVPWNLGHIRYSHQQRGSGIYSLCNDCNSMTGTLYGADYAKFANSFGKFILDNDLKAGEVYQFKVQKVKSLSVVKQMISMICSLNQESDDKRLDELRSFVLDKEKNDLDLKKYKICMYLRVSGMTRYNGIWVSLVVNPQKGCNNIIVFSEVCAFPIGFILYFNPEDSMEYVGCDISSFTKYSYGEEADIVLPTEVLEANSYLPNDYRSKEEIIEEIKKNNEIIDNYNSTIKKDIE